MHFSTLVQVGCLILAVAQALPTKPAAPLQVREELDEDDKVVYAWALPESKAKREVDEDDKVVYAWALPDSKTKREVDEDDKVVYAWALPTES